MDTQTIVALALFAVVTLLLMVLAWGLVPSTKRAARVEREPVRVVVRGPIELL